MASYKRCERVSGLIQEEVSKIVHEEIKDPRIGFVTVTKVDLSPDLRYTRIFVSIYGDEDVIKKSMEGLKKATPFIRREIGARIKLRYTPEICFKYDETVQKAAHIFNLLNKVKQEEKKTKKGNN